MKNILTIESSISLANQLELMGTPVYEDLHEFSAVDCTIAYSSLALEKNCVQVTLRT